MHLPVNFDPAGGHSNRAVRLVVILEELAVRNWPPRDTELVDVDVPLRMFIVL